MSRQNPSRNIVEALIFEKATGSYEMRSELTGEIEIEHVHRLTAATAEEVAVGGERAEYCILGAHGWLDYFW